jgi:hypothetical protein
MYDIMSEMRGLGSVIVFGPVIGFIGYSFILLLNFLATFSLT